MHVVPQLLVSTILLGGIYALIAVGLTLIFGVMRVVNFAHGEFVMLGMYLAFWAFARLGPPAFNISQIVAFTVAVLFTAALFAFMRWSYTGKVMRATAQERAVASLMGIDTGRVFALTWAVGVTCVGVAGVLLAPIYPVYPTVGLQFVLIAYVAVVLGGLGDMAGALLSSLIVAAVEVIGSYGIGTAWEEGLYPLLFIGILVVPPAGLFGQRGAEAIGT